MTTETETPNDDAAPAGDSQDAGAESATTNDAGDQTQDSAAGAEAGAEAEQSPPSDGFGARAGDDGAGADLPDFGDAYKGEDGKPDLSKVAERLKAVDEAEAARAEKVGAVPESPDGYELPTAEDLDLPDGFKGGFDKDDPSLKAFLEEAHSLGKGAKQVKAELASYAKAVSESIKSYHAQQSERIDAEFKKVGPERFNAATNALKTLGGDEGESWAQALGSIDNAELFTVVESLIQKASGGGDSPPGRSGGDFSNDVPFAERWARAGKKTA